MQAVGENLANKRTTLTMSWVTSAFADTSVSSAAEMSSAKNTSGLRMSGGGGGSGGRFCAAPAALVAFVAVVADVAAGDPPPKK
jgi:hypothetical protein